MNLRTLLIALSLAALAAFAALNWPAFNAPTALWLGFAEVQAPLGLVMLAVTGAVTALFLVYVVYQQVGVIGDSRRYAKELKAHRELADKAEASRFVELRGFLEAELRRLDAQGAAGARELGARIDRLEQSMQERLAEATRTLSACVGEVEDKLDRSRPPTSL